VNTPEAQITLRPLRTADIPLAMELKDIAGWNQTARDWAGYLEFEPAGCFAAEANGRPVGTATSIRYGDRFGWIGMVLVHPECRRFGIGSRLLRAGIDYLQRSGTGCVKLDATPMGKKVYVPLGFQDEYEITRFEGVAGPLPGEKRRRSFEAASADATPGRIDPLIEGDLPAVIEFDAPVFGAERANVLHSMSRRNPEMCFVARDATGSIDGYLIAREGQRAVQLGPWIARDAVTAAGLLDAFFGGVAGQRVFLDVPHPNESGLELIREAGFSVQRGFARMHLGPNLHPGLPQFVYGTSSAEKG
jgi:ribosomal protein S18 acetylase RimI-like enzyme